MLAESKHFLRRAERRICRTVQTYRKWSKMATSRDVERLSAMNFTSKLLPCDVLDVIHCCTLHSLPLPLALPLRAKTAMEDPVLPRWFLMSDNDWNEPRPILRLGARCTPFGEGIEGPRILHRHGLNVYFWGVHVWAHRSGYNKITWSLRYARPNLQAI